MLYSRDLDVLRAQRLFYLDYPQINEVRKSDHVVNIVHKNLVIIEREAWTTRPEDIGSVSDRLTFALEKVHPRKTFFAEASVVSVCVLAHSGGFFTLLFLLLTFINIC